MPLLRTGFHGVPDECILFIMQMLLARYWVIGAYYRGLPDGEALVAARAIFAFYASGPVIMRVVKGNAHVLYGVKQVFKQRRAVMVIRKDVLPQLQRAHASLVNNNMHDIVDIVPLPLRLSVQNLVKCLCHRTGVPIDPSLDSEVSDSESDSALAD